MKGLPKTLAVNEKGLVKYFELGNHVKVVSGAQEGATGMVVKVEQHVLILISDTTKAQEGAPGMVVKVEQHVLILISDTTKEHIRVFADDVVESSEVTIVPKRFSQGGHLFGSGGGRHKGGRGHDGLIGATVKVRHVLYKGYCGRVIKVKGTFVRVELQSQIKVVTVDRNHITNNVAVNSQRETYRYGMENFRLQFSI
ncbi:hypothetical protein RYX36_014147 [Vicia faba]